MERLPISQPGVVGPACGLHKFLFNCKCGKARFNAADLRKYTKPPFRPLGQAAASQPQVAPSPSGVTARASASEEATAVGGLLTAAAGSVGVSLIGI